MIDVERGGEDGIRDEGVGWGLDRGNGIAKWKKGGEGRRGGGWRRKGLVMGREKEERRK